MLGIDFDVFDAQGKRVAVIAKSVVAQADADAYDVTCGHDVYSVTERSTGRVIVRVQRRGVADAELDLHIDTYLPNGAHLIAGPDKTNFGGPVIQDLIFDGGGVGNGVNFT